MTSTARNWGNSGATGAALIVNASTGATTSTLSNTSSTAVSMNPSSTTLNANLNITPTGDIDWYGTGSSGTGKVILGGSGTLKLYNGNAFNGSTSELLCRKSRVSRRFNFPRARRPREQWLRVLGPDVDQRQRSSR